MIKLNKDIKHAACVPSLHIAFADGSTADIDAYGIGYANTQLAEGAGVSALPVGCAVGKTLQIELVNEDGQWDDKDFFGALVDFKLDYGDNTSIIWREFAVTEPPESLGNFIIFKCLDNMWRADKAYYSRLAYPSTLGAVWREACEFCGLQNATAAHEIFNKPISAALSSDLTFRQVFGYIAGAAGGNARINTAGEIALIDWTIPTAQTDTSKIHNLDNWISLTPALHDMTITGVSTVTQNDAGETEEILAGATGYVLQIEDNPIIQANPSYYLQHILDAVGGVPIRAYSGNAFFYSVAEFGDACAVVSVKDEILYSVITDVSWSLGGPTEIKNGMASPLTAGSQYYDPSIKALVEARRLVSKERTARENAIIELQTALANASGLYETAEQQADGSYIYYLHDKPQLSDSTNIIKLTSDAIGLSTDGGQTYPYGFTLTGDMVTRILSSVGVSADWINTGALVVKDDDGTVLFSADVGAGTVYIDGVTVDDGVITIGLDSSNMRVVINDDSVQIQQKGVNQATFGSRQALLPQETVIPRLGALQFGNYQIHVLSTGNFEIIFTGQK